MSPFRFFRSLRAAAAAALSTGALLTTAPALAAAPPSAAAPAPSSKVPVETFTLSNGMEFLLIRKPELSTISTGWVAKVGSANERPGITGISHFFEHMMFKGTKTIGTKDAVRDGQIIDEQEAIQDKLRTAYQEQRERWRRGEIDDPWDAKNRTPEMVELEKKFQTLVEEQRGLMVKDEMDQIYSNAGGTGLNAGTFNDMTFYFVTVPANKLELWFWLESDRLAGPVFREFYSERDVVHEERRLRTESTPTGKFAEQLDAIFWQSHPYNWPVVGWPSDLRSYSLQQAKDYYSTYYAPNNIVVALVGNFEISQVQALAKKYFERIPRGKIAPPDVVTTEMEQLAEKRMDAECDCQPQIEVRYHTVPFEHADSYALDVLTGIMNGQTGRLNKQLVLKDQVASTAGTGQESDKWAGYFSFTAETKGDATPETLEEAWYTELKKVQEQPIPAKELEKVKNQIAADAFRQLQSPFFLLFQLGYYEGRGDWRYMNQWADKTLAVTAEDVQRVAKEYFTPENRTVGVYRRKAGTGAEGDAPDLGDIPPSMKQSIQQQVKMLKSMTDIPTLEAAMAQIQQQKAAAPSQFQKAIAYVEGVVEARINELKSGGAAAAQGGGQ